MKSEVSEITLAEPHKINIYLASIDKHIVLYSYNGISHSNKKKNITVICNRNDQIPKLESTNQIYTHKQYDSVLYIYNSIKFKQAKLVYYEINNHLFIWCEKEDSINLFEDGRINDKEWNQEFIWFDENIVLICVVVTQSLSDVFKIYILNNREIVYKNKSGN